MARESVIIKIEKMYDDVELPAYAKEGDSGMDVRAYLSDKFLEKVETDKMTNPKTPFRDKLGKMEGKHVIIAPHQSALIPTGIKTIIPDGYEIQVRPRSGLALKKGISVLNSPGTIDSEYRHEYGIIIHNTSDDLFVVEHGDRIAQLVLMEVPKVAWEVIDDVGESDRKGGFGSTGEK